MPVSFDRMRRAAGLALLVLLPACAPVATLPSAPADRPTATSAPAPARPSRTSARAAEARAAREAEARLLTVPVQGVARERLRDSYNADRSGGRLHRALDIAAPLGTPVVAAGAGMVRQMKENTLGGITAVVVAEDGQTVHYYAHLDRYAEGLREGQRVRAGQRIGYVGTTGNAQGPHLHFAMWRIRDAQRFWEGEVVNPYDHLRAPEPVLAEASGSRARLPRPTAAPAPPARPGAPAARPSARPSVDEQVRDAATRTTVARPTSARPAARPVPAPTAPEEAPRRRRVGW